MLYKAYLAELSDGIPGSSTAHWCLQITSRDFTPLRGPLAPVRSALLRVEIESHDPEMWAWATPLHADPERDGRFLRKQCVGNVDADFFTQVTDVARRTWCLDVLDALCNVGMFVWCAGERAKAKDRVVYGV
ncbi:hypothetical protein ESCO_002765 [Escovopsis weberi]|uniref:Uncharacterized protein n=1 Tax=Escovopsis weberi TaxID=150374 RepID=A0A0M8MS40_ESCWE|nr:hypothetical protein ESCO_002765 [Escovopsis weberi]